MLQTKVGLHSLKVKRNIRKLKEVAQLCVSPMYPRSTHEFYRVTILCACSEKRGIGTMGDNFYETVLIWCGCMMLNV